MVFDFIIPPSLVMNFLRMPKYFFFLNSSNMLPNKNYLKLGNIIGLFYFSILKVAKSNFLI